MKTGDNTLSVISCVFKDCHSTNDGGAVYVESIAYVTVEASLFFHCYTTGHNDEDGGCFTARYISKQPFIKRSQFINSPAGDGGGVALVYSACSYSLALTECSFLSCNATGSESEGGGLFFWDSTTPVSSSDLLFYNCYCEKQGGAIRVYAYRSALKYSISFCFFAANRAAEGNDIYFTGLTPGQNSPLVHCFSTTQGNRIYPYGHEDWLPQAILPAVFTYE